MNDNVHLFDRIGWASQNLIPVRTDYVIVWEKDPDEPVQITIPAPEWLAMALAGGLLPDVEHYHREQRDGEGSFCGPRDYWSRYAAIEPLTIREALEYLVQKDLPRKVWDDPGSNRPRFWICTRDQVPSNRLFRNAWRLAMSDQEQTPSTIIATPTGEIDASEVEIPASGRTFRDAWRVEGDVIAVDMEAAREIARTKIRLARQPVLERLDVEVLRAQEDRTAIDPLVDKKKRLRDMTKDDRLAAASDDKSLEAALLQILKEIEET